MVWRWTCTSATSASHQAVVSFKCSREWKLRPPSKLDSTYPKWSFHFSLGLGPPGPTGDRSKTVMGRERQEPWIVDGLVAVVPAHHDFHVVIKTGCRDSAQVLEGADVLADGRGEVLALDEVQVLPARVAQHIAEGINPAAAFDREIDVVGGVIHLRLLSRCGLEPPHGLDDGPRTQRTHPLAEQRVAPLVTEPAQLLVDSLRRDVGIAGQQVGDRPYVGIELAASAAF